ncbi:regulator of G-protein signaling 22 isoform X2 [Rhinatrema bivittatum]|uniref:regulator of G-protein signaling 22 isoform X2 n=1 Tax=Rhinatrema bivittatum TaxID=194408 RepID=UPI00112E4205|nr:regulator of G-protein signaling 22 isoform X2 [Rhinatrema bivittatum]
MREKRLTTEPPVLTENNFEDLLATDDLLVDYFNEFLSLPVFSQSVKFNRIYGNFEMVDEASLRLKQKLKKLLQISKQKSSIFDVTQKMTGCPNPHKKRFDMFNIDTHYAVTCLKRKQGLQWIKKERLPIFLSSDCYFEYRLAKLMSQVKLSSSGITLRIDPRYRPWSSEKEKLSLLRTSIISSEEEDKDITKKLFVSVGEASFTQTKDWFTLAKQSQLTTSTTSISRPLAWGPVQEEDSNVLSVSTTSLGADFEEDVYKPLDRKYSSATFSLARTSEMLSDEKINESLKNVDEEYSMSFVESPSPTPIRVYIQRGWETESTEEQESHKEERQELDDHTIEDKETAIETIDLNGNQYSATVQDTEKFAAAYVDHLLKDTVAKLMREPTGFLDKRDTYGRFKEIVDSSPHRETSTPLEQSGSQTSSSESDQDVLEFRDEDSLSSESDDEETKNKVNGSAKRKTINSRKKFEKFKLFLKGTLGEKNWWLWMDIERLRSIKDPKRQQRHLIKMRKLYLVASEDHSIHAEILLKLGLRDGNQWNTNHLYHIQAQVVKPLLLYWGPRYCLTHSALGHASDAIKLWRNRQLRPKKNINPFPQTITLLPLRAKSAVPRISSSQKTGRSSPTPFHKKDKQPPRLLSASVVEYKDYLKKKPDSATSKSESSGKRYSSGRLRTSESSDLTDRSQQLRTKQDKKGSRGKRLKHGSSRALIEEMSTMELMLQALHLESRAGYYFTRFCELSGNQLWKNSINFWFDMQNFRNLFYQETLQPFKLSNQANFLYATYLAPSATMDIGALQTIKSDIYYKLDPPFDDLFDSAEDHALSHLLDAWKEMTEMDKRAFGQVEMEEEIRRLESVYMKKLKAIYLEHIARRAEGAAYKTGFLSLADFKFAALPSSGLPPRDSIFQPLPDSSYLPPPDSSFLSPVASFELPPFLSPSAFSFGSPDSSVPSMPMQPEILEEKDHWEEVPEEYQNINLSVLSHTGEELDYFRDSLMDQLEKMDLSCWEDIEQFRKMQHKDKEKRETKSKDIKKKYLNKKYFFGPFSPASKDEQDQIMQLSGGWGQMLQETLPSSVLPEIQKHVRRRLETKALPKFLATDQFRERNKIEKLETTAFDPAFSQRQDSMISLLDLETPTVTSTGAPKRAPKGAPTGAPKRPAESFFETTWAKDFAEDAVFHIKKKKVSAWKEMEGKWIAPSKEIIAFRKALSNPMTAKQFQRFIALSDDYLENGLLFWLEVQKYKDLCHSHCDDTIIQHKISTIISCFINSTVPPSLQIDIPPEQAERIIEHRKDLGPYIFREAQLTVFNTLFKLWPEFSKFKGNLSNDKILPLLDKRKNKQLKQMKKKMKEEGLGKADDAAYLSARRFEDLDAGGARREKLTSLMSKHEDKKRSTLRSSIFGRPTSRDRTLYGFNATGTWSYSKYLEAIEQERMLLKLQEDLERSSSSFFTDMSSIYTVKTESIKPSGKSNTPSIQVLKP